VIRYASFWPPETRHLAAMSDQLPLAGASAQGSKAPFDNRPVTSGLSQTLDMSLHRTKRREVPGTDNGVTTRRTPMHSFVRFCGVTALTLRPGGRCRRYDPAQGSFESPRGHVWRLNLWIISRPKNVCDTGRHEISLLAGRLLS
jgi:hypothetical protein